MDKLPAFLPFDSDVDKSSAGPRWERWLNRLENLFVAIELDDDTRRRALLLHYVGDKAYDIYEAQKGETETTYVATKQVLSTYFKPRKNTQIEVYNFRSCAQKEEQSLDEFVTDLRRLSKDCEFTNVDKEILTQVIQNCKSNQLRRRALREPDKTLDDILKYGRAMELAETQALTMERQQTVNAVSTKRGNNQKKPHSNVQNSNGFYNQRYTNSPRGNRKKTDPKTNSSQYGLYQKQAQSTQCRNCGGTFPHKSGPCPAKGKQCYECQGQGHFGRICRNKSTKRRVKVVDVETPRDESEDEYCYGVQEIRNIYSKKMNNGPYVNDKLQNRDTKLLIDSGSSVNILDTTDYERLGRPMLKKAKNKLLPYGGGESLQVKGTCMINVETTKTYDVIEFYVVEKKHCGSLLGYQSATKLSLLEVIRQVQVGNVEDEFPELFRGIGKLRNRRARLHINSDVPPVAQRHRRTPFHLRDKVKIEIDKLLAEDIIEKVEGVPTPWVSPIVTPPKKNPDEIRLCVDMREANKAILRERHVMPTIDELILDLNGAQMFSKLDLRSGYHQLELETDSRYISTFSTHLGLFRYKRLNFGISSASEVFQEMIRQVIEEIEGSRNISDDIIIYGKNKMEHDTALRETLNRLSDSGLTLNKSKCEYRKEKISFFGVVFSKDGISADPEKVKAVREFQQPENVKVLRSFLGMTNYCSHFIEGYKKFCEPLRELTHEDALWNWNEECEMAFRKLKNYLLSDTVVAYYDPRKPVQVRVDASPIGLGAVLVQDKVVSYASRSLTPVESRYSQVEREALGVVWACAHYDTYLRGLKQFTVITDHKPLEKIWQKQKLPSLRIERWGLRLQPYKLNIKYEPGETNVADYMSRHPVKSTKSTQEEIAECYVKFVTEEALPCAIQLDEVKEATLHSPTLQKAIEFTRNGRWYDTKKIGREENIDMEELTAIKSVRDELTDHSDNILLRDHRIILPASLRDRAIRIAHEGHQGMAKTKSFIRSKIWFPGIDSKVETAVRDCMPCQILTPETRMEPLRMSELPTGPWGNVSIDFCGPLTTGEYLMVVVDEFSRYPCVEILRSVSANAAIPVLDKVFTTFGTPRIVKSDNGSPFNSDAFRKYALNQGFNHRRITPRWPRANSQAESFNKPLMKVVRAAHYEKKELFGFLRQYRATSHSTTGQTPYRLMFGREQRTKMPQVAERQQNALHEQVRERDSNRKCKMKLYADARNHAKDSEISVGDVVVVKQDMKGNKLTPSYDPQPRTVTNRKGPMITVDGKTTRNVSRFKKINQCPGKAQQSKQLDEEIEELKEDLEAGKPVNTPEKQPVCVRSNPTISTHCEVMPPLRKSTRERKKNTRYDDFVPN